MDGLDLDINNYTIKDLETFFKINASNKAYTAADIELREAEIREALLSSGHIDKKFKRDLIMFLETAKDWLIVAKCKNESAIKPYRNTAKTEQYPASREAMPRTEELMVRPDTPYVNTYNSEYFPGAMNPLKTRVISKCLNIDTRFRDNITTSNSSDFMLTLPVRLQKVVSMQITAIEFPVSFYGISSKYGNHHFYISVACQPQSQYDNKYDENGGDVFTESRVVKIKDGNYNASDLIDEINNSMVQLESNIVIDASNIDTNSLFQYVEFTLDITESGSGTGKVNVTHTTETLGNKIISISLDFTRDINGIPDTTPVTSKIGMNLGFLKRKYEGALSYTSETLIEPANIRYLYLAIDDFNNNVNNHFISAFNQSILSPNILARISVKGSYFSLMMETDLLTSTEPRKYFGPVDIQKLHIQVYDDHGRILDTNNSNFSCCILFKMLYDL
jgi:hypothetical protein